MTPRVGARRAFLKTSCSRPSRRSRLSNCVSPARPGCRAAWRCYRIDASEQNSSSACIGGRQSLIANSNVALSQRSVCFAIAAPHVRLSDHAVHPIVAADYDRRVDLRHIDY